MSDTDTQLAIACQGGGAHTAFTAGALKRLLPAVTTDYDLVGLSGTSGGALCAVTAWYGLMTDGPARAAELLDAVWADAAATSPTEQLLNEAALWNSRLDHSALPIPHVSPYAIPGQYAQRWFRQLVERHIAFEQFDALVTATSPQVTIATVNVNTGTFETITDAAITPG